MCMCLVVVVVFYSFVHKSKEQSYLLWQPCLHFCSLCGEKNSCTQKKLEMDVWYFTSKIYVGMTFKVQPLLLNLGTPKGSKIIMRV